ncbi:hypothetical protein [Iodobacter ciconiae]|uniref:Uncharacterized protein n=1 Tax=Iodobacter ciconiae TaxID=2496266 RepID=A0A3S8ZTD8_9NEIS|nr:hypothetical protein [Iodobacter ciconiae]AZN36685.1 hypothetical protein EJO50_09395 [Iodobacter ciconiae]
MDTQTTSAQWSARNQLDVAHNREQQSLRRLVVYAGKSFTDDVVGVAVHKAGLSQDEVLYLSLSDGKVPGIQLLLSQMLMASALHWPQLSAAKPDTAAHARPAPRVENALASYLAIAAVGEAESEAGLAATA